MYSWQKGVLFLARQESRKCCVFISDGTLSGLFLSLTIGGTAKFKQLDLSCSLDKLNLQELLKGSHFKSYIFGEHFCYAPPPPLNFSKTKLLIYVYVCIYLSIFCVLESVK